MIRYTVPFQVRERADHLRTCVHEAGHWHAAVERGATVTAIHVRGYGHGDLQWSMPELWPQTDIVAATVAYAGVAAAERGGFIAASEGGDHDLQVAMDACKRINSLDSGAKERECRRDAQRLVADNWPLVQRLAWILVEHPDLEGHRMIADAYAAASRGERWVPPRIGPTLKPKPWMECARERAGTNAPAPPLPETRGRSGCSPEPGGPDDIQAPIAT